MQEQQQQWICKSRYEHFTLLSERVPKPNFVYCVYKMCADVREYNLLCNTLKFINAQHVCQQVNTWNRILSKKMNTCEFLLLVFLTKYVLDVCTEGSALIHLEDRVSNHKYTHLLYTRFTCIFIITKSMWFKICVHYFYKLKLFSKSHIFMKS